MSIPTTQTIPFKPTTELSSLGGEWIQPPMDSKTVTVYVPEPKQMDPNKIGGK